MATEGGGKIKTKRNQAPNKPYDRKSTLFGKLTSSVKDLLIPSWLSRSPDKDGSSEGGRHQDAQASTSSNSNPSFGSQSESPGHQHRSAGGGMNAAEQSSTFIDLTQDSNDQNAPGFSGHGQGPNSLIGEPYMDSTYCGRVPNVNIASLGKQSVDWRSKKPDLPSTSKLPSATSHQNESRGKPRDPVRLRMSDSYLDDTDDQEVESTPVRPIMISTVGMNRSSNLTQPAAKKQRLWSPEIARQGRPLVPPVKERPAFNSLLFGSPNKSDTSMFGEGFGESTFYSGKTRFGGAAGERRPLNASLPYQSSLPLRKQVKASRMNSSFHATTSATAQRILETLDRMSTPLGDAKKIPQTNESANDSVLSFTPSSYRRTSLLGSGRPVTRPLQIPGRGPPTSQHQALSQAVIAKNRHKAGIVDKRQGSFSREGQDEAEESTSGLAVSQEPAAVREVTLSAPAVSTSQPSGGMGKMKTKRFSQHISSNRGADDDEVVEVPNLRTDFTLPISNINPISLPSQPVKSHTVASASIPLMDKSMPLKFTFSTPIEENRRPSNSQMPNSSEKGFKFSSPIQASQTKTSAAGAEEGSKSSPEPAVGASSGVTLGGTSAAFSAPVPAWGSIAPKPKVASPDIGGTSSSFKSYSKWGGFGKNNDNSAASDSASPAGFSLAPAASLKTGSVMDILGGNKAPAPAPATDDLMAKFKKPAGTWECDACMLANKPEATKCVACETPKPGAKQSQSTAASTLPKPSMATSPPATDDLMAKFKKPAGTWECGVCMISNKPEATKCVACESPKPGAKQSQTSAGSSSNNNSLSAMFKKPAGNWECDTCMVQNTATALRCIACDSPKPGLQAAGLVSKPSVSGSGSSAISISPAGGFVINVSATTTTTTGSGGFRFGNTNSSSTPSTSLPAPTGFVFGQTANKDSTSQSSNGSSSATPLTGGFKFGATSTGDSDSGGTTTTTTGTSGFGGAKGGTGFVFGSTSTIVSTKSNDSASGFQFGQVSKSSLTTDSCSKPGVSVTEKVSNGQSESLSNGSSTTDLNKSNNFVAPSSVGFQFGSTSSFPSATVSASGITTVQPASGLEPKDNATKPTTPQVNFNFNTPSTSSTAPPSTFMLASSQPQSSEKTDSSSAAKPASNLFQFGSSGGGIVSAPSTGLGMGKSLSDNSNHMVNGGFGSGVTGQGAHDSSKSTSQESSKPSGGFAFGTAASTPVFGSFGQTPAPVTAPAPVVTQSSQPAKRSVDFVEMGAPSAKKSFNFGASSSEPSSNGLFAFGSSSDPKATPFGASAPGGTGAGGFVFGSNTSQPAQTGAPAPGGGFQMPTGSNTMPAAAPNFNFTFKAQTDGSKPAFEMSAQPVANKGIGGISVPPSFNFSATPQQPSSTPFQFSARPADGAAQAGVFAFGASSQGPGASTDSPGFGTVGSFNVGTGGDGRKVKKAMRRIRKT